MLNDLLAQYKQDDIIALALPIFVNVLVAIAIYIIGTWIANKLVGLLDKLMIKRSVDAALRQFSHAIVGTVLKVVIFLVAVERLGIDTTSLLALLGAAGLAVGLALKDSLSNFAAGVMLILFKPFTLGHFIEAGGVSGVVEKITIFNTILATTDNKEVTVPNAQIYSGSITNYSAKATRRVDLKIGISYGDNIKDARDIIQAIINADERILKTPEPVIAVGELGDSSVNFVVRSWVKTSDYWVVYWHLLEEIKCQFDAKGISIPFPQRDVHLYKTD